MKTRMFLYALAPVALCEVALAAATGGVLDVRQTMQAGVNAATMEIWDVGNNAMDDAGGIDPEQMSPERWAQLETAAQSLKDIALAMHDADGFIAASPENTPEEGEPGAVSMADVQRYIDADPDGFRAAAQGLADHAGLLVDAAQGRDAKAAGGLVAQLDQVCEVCHAQFWYPDQQQNAVALR
jgi:cytochrome c556